MKVKIQSIDFAWNTKLSDKICVKAMKETKKSTIHFKASKFIKINTKLIRKVIAYKRIQRCTNTGFCGNMIRIKSVKHQN
jgi:hypothetical protein